MSRDEKGRYVAGGVSEHRRQWIGEQFGKLVVIDVEYGVRRNNRARTICKCQCECGNIIETVSDRLLAGKTSCGCDTKQKRIESQRIDLIGQRFGRLVVREMLWDSPYTNCKCICDCGNEVIVRKAQLSNGKTRSCGCLQRERASEYNTKDFSGSMTSTGIRFIKCYKQQSRGVWIWECECPICHSSFYGIPAKLECSGTMSCGCASMSYGEELIAKELQSLGANYARQYSMPDCKNIHELHFDFAIFDNNDNLIHIIEYDGIQHYKPLAYFGGEETYDGIVLRDNIKNKYCQTHNIPLTRLPYTMSDQEIKDTIKNIINP